MFANRFIQLRCLNTPTSKNARVGHLLTVTGYEDANLVVAGLQKNQNPVTSRRDYYKAGDAAIRYDERATTAHFSPQSILGSG